MDYRRQKIEDGISQTRNVISELEEKRTRVYEKIKDFTVDATTAGEGIKKLRSIKTQLEKEKKSLERQEKNLRDYDSN